MVVMPTVKIIQVLFLKLRAGLAHSEINGLWSSKACTDTGAEKVCVSLVCFWWRKRSRKQSIAKGEARTNTQFLNSIFKAAFIMGV